MGLFYQLLLTSYTEPFHFLPLNAVQPALSIYREITIHLRHENSKEFKREAGHSQMSLGFGVTKKRILSQNIPVPVM